MNAKQVLRVVSLVVLSIQVSSNEIKTLYTNGPGYSQYFPLEENMAEGNILRFSVRAPRDAYILLATSHEADQPVYEIVLGARNNRVNYIQGRYPGQKEASVATRTVNLLSNGEFRNLWIRLKNDAKNTSVIIQVGIPYENSPILEWRDTNPLQPKYLSFRSETLATWKYGYSDESYTKGLSKDKRQSVVTMTKNGPTYGQYFPLSELVSRSDGPEIVFYFTVQTSKELQILLSPKATPSGDRYEFGLNKKEMYINRQPNGVTDGQSHTKVYSEDGLVNEQSRLKYWIKFDKDGQILMGKGDSVEPILFWNDPNPVSPQFVSFTLIQPKGEDFDPTSRADVQYGFGPDYTFGSQDCKPRWKDASGPRLLPASVRGGYNDRDELFVCMAVHNLWPIPGSFVPGDDGSGVCLVPWGLLAHSIPEFQVLTGCHITWVAPQEIEIPAGAVMAVDYPIKKNAEYVSRVAVDGQLIIGKISSCCPVARVGYNNSELPSVDYEVLVYSN